MDSETNEILAQILANSTDSTPEDELSIHTLYMNLINFSINNEQFKIETLSDLLTFSIQKQKECTDWQKELWKSLTLYHLLIISHRQFQKFDTVINDFGNYQDLVQVNETLKIKLKESWNAFLDAV